MMQRLSWLGAWLLFCACAMGQVQRPPLHSPLIVGIKEAPPFVMKDADGKWTGISIELWQDLATELKLDYQFKELDLEQLLSAVRSNSVDAAVAAITVTADRERVMDFTHPFYITGLGIAVSLASSYGP